MIGIVITVILYFVFRKVLEYSRLKSAILGVGIYAIAPAPVTYFILTMLGVGEILPYLALVPEQHAPAIVKQWGEDLNLDQTTSVPKAEPQAPSVEPESSY